MMKHFAALALAALFLTGTLGKNVRLQAAPLDRIAVGGPVHITVNYKGKGAVDGKHRVWVWLFDTPEIGPGSMPIAETSVEATLNFDDSLRMP